MTGGNANDFELANEILISELTGQPDELVEAVADLSMEERANRTIATPGKIYFRPLRKKPDFHNFFANFRGRRVPCP